MEQERSGRIVGDIYVRPAVIVVIKECRAGAVHAFGGKEASFLCYVDERAVAVVVIKHVLPVVGHKQVQMAVAVVIAHTDALAPSVMNESSVFCDVSKGAVAIVAIEVVRGLLSFGKAFDP